MAGDSKTLLLLESDDGTREMIQSIVLDHDLSMQTAYNLEDALHALAKTKVFAFAFNLALIDREPFEFVRHLKHDYPDLPLLAIVDESHLHWMVDLLKAGTYACLNLPLQMEDLAFNLSKIIANTTETYNPFSMRYEERILIMPNDFALVMQVAKNLVDSTLPPNEKNRYHIILGLSEIINNAIEHGSLGITFEEKSNALKASRFYPLAIERSHKEPYKDRVVTIRSRVFPTLRRIEYFVADQGSGFDWRSLPDPKDKSNLLNRNGRGIMMARYAFDEMIYNEVGNEVTLVVNLDLPYRGRRG
ncbi:MAG TPA: ATP-binding protein [Fibrobacteria bacterium]|nr:ATP-binding protein [Fibrobacteria bacterium]